MPTAWIRNRHKPRRRPQTRPVLQLPVAQLVEPPSPEDEREFEEKPERGVAEIDFYI